MNPEKDSMRAFEVDWNKSFKTTLRECNDARGERTVPFYQTNPPIFDGFFDVINTLQGVCAEKLWKNSVGSFAKTNPPGGVLLRADDTRMGWFAGETNPPD